eukprot:TRINITY_DN677_c0_g3_i1.p1 TRINITY_DN677_c0_g3~~TRINITY_DN677_c0_g3_i1.p1  ORF type:complete len:513 (-),score=74.71 TRINITY_DN677_c0_g3_i1:81-1619(-)
MANEWKAFEPPSQLPEKTKIDWMEALKRVADVQGVPQTLEIYDEKGLDAMMTKATVPDMLQSKLRDHWRSLKGSRFYNELGGWVPDLTRECVEPNPGPPLTAILQHLDETIKLECGGVLPEPYLIDRAAFESAIKAKFPGLYIYDHTHVHDLLHDENKMVEIWHTRENADSIKRSLLEFTGPFLQGIAQSGGAVSSTDSEMKELMKKMHTTALEQTEVMESVKSLMTRLVEDNHSFTFSKIPSSWKCPFEIRTIAKPDVRHFLKLPDRVGFPPVFPYSWLDTSEADQMTEIMEWLGEQLFEDPDVKIGKSQIQPPPALSEEFYQLQDRHGDTNRLRFPLGGAVYKGGVDVGIVDGEREEDAWQNTHVVFEIKKPTVLKKRALACERQWEAELIGSNLISNYSVVSILTDLGNYWAFQWFSGDGQVTRTYIDITGTALAFLRAILSSRPSYDKPHCTLPVNQVSMKLALPQVFGTKTQSDVAQLVDLLPFVSREEQCELRHEISRQILYSMYI